MSRYGWEALATGRGTPGSSWKMVSPTARASRTRRARSSRLNRHRAIGCVRWQHQIGMKRARATQVEGESLCTIEPREARTAGTRVKASINNTIEREPSAFFKSRRCTAGWPEHPVCSKLDRPRWRPAPPFSRTRIRRASSDRSLRPMTRVNNGDSHEDEPQTFFGAVMAAHDRASNTNAQRCTAKRRP